MMASRHDHAIGFHHRKAAHSNRHIFVHPPSGRSMHKSDMVCNVHPHLPLEAGFSIRLNISSIRNWLSRTSASSFLSCLTWSTSVSDVSVVGERVEVTLTLDREADLDFELPLPSAAPYGSLCSAGERASPASGPGIALDCVLPDFPFDPDAEPAFDLRPLPPKAAPPPNSLASGLSNPLDRVRPVPCLRLYLALPFLAFRSDPASASESVSLELEAEGTRVEAGAERVRSVSTCSAEGGGATSKTEEMRTSEPPPSHELLVSCLEHMLHTPVWQLPGSCAITSWLERRWHLLKHLGPLHTPRSPAQLFPLFQMQRARLAVRPTLICRYQEENGKVLHDQYIVNHESDRPFAGHDKAKSSAHLWCPTDYKGTSSLVQTDR